MVSQLAEKDAEIAGCKAKLTEQEEYISKMKEQSEKGENWKIEFFSLKKRFLSNQIPFFINL